MKRWTVALGVTLVMTTGTLLVTAGPAAAAANPRLFTVSCRGEQIDIGNFGNADLQMEGWKLWDHGRLHTFTFPRFTLKAGKFVRVWSGGRSGGSIPSFVGWRGSVWNNDGDRATLARPTGAVYVTGNCTDVGGP